MEISDIYSVIELQLDGVETQATLLEVNSEYHYTVGCPIDASLVTKNLLAQAKAFNDIATDILITFQGGKLVSLGDVQMFMLIFDVELYEN